MRMFTTALFIMAQNKKYHNVIIENGLNELRYMQILGCNGKVVTAKFLKYSIVIVDYLYNLKNQLHVLWR